MPVYYFRVILMLTGAFFSGVLVTLARLPLTMLIALLTLAIFYLHEKRHRDTVAGLHRLFQEVLRQHHIEKALAVKRAEDDARRASECADGSSVPAVPDSNTAESVS